MRKMGVAAGRGVHYAAQYYFGSRQRLASAIFEYRMEAINQRRLQILEELDEAGEADRVQGLVEALVVPLHEAVGYRRKLTFYARFIAQVAFEPDLDFFTNLVSQPFMSGWSRVLDGLLTALHDLPPAEAVTRTHLLL